MGDTGRLTPEMCEREGQSEEHAAWLAEWRRVGAPPGSMRYAMNLFVMETNAMARNPLLPRDFTLPHVEDEDC